MKKILFMALLFCSGTAYAFPLDGSMTGLQIKDQFGKEHVIAVDTKFVLYADNKKMNGLLNDYFKSRPKGFLEKNRACYVADISGMPSLIAKMFALPKMRKYFFSVLLVDEEQAVSFDKKENCVTVYSLKDGKIFDIQYVKTAEELDAIFK